MKSVKFLISKMLYETTELLHISVVGGKCSIELTIREMAENHEDDIFEDKGIGTNKESSPYSTRLSCFQNVSVHTL